MDHLIYDAASYWHRSTSSSQEFWQAILLELPVQLDRTSRQPLADQLAEQIRSITARGSVRVGEKLPSTRDLATELGVSRTVTAAAYDQLHAEGWISARRGAGTFVAAVPAAQAEPESIDDYADEGDDPGIVDLRSGSPWAAGMSQETWRRAWRAASDDAPGRYPVRSGLPEFRAAIGEFMLRHRGLTVGPSRVLATSGTSAAVVEFAQAMLAPGDAVAVEDPGYARAVGAFQAAGIGVLPLPVDSSGVLVDQIPAGVRAVYCTPAHQYPLGGRLTAGRRIDLANWARATGGWVIEDDYDGELRYDVAPLPLLAALGSDVVVHLGTSSKIVSPSLGVGWLVAPPSVVEAIVAHRDRAGTAPSAAGQRVFTAMATSGDLSRHLRRVRKEFAERRETVVKVLESAGLTVWGDDAGAHVVIPMADLDRERHTIKAAEAEGIVVEGIEKCFNGEPTTAGVILGYAAPRHRSMLTDAVSRLLPILPR